MSNRLVKALARIKLKDTVAPFIFLIMLVPSFFFKLMNKLCGRKLWLVAEEGEARDNGYHFFKYTRENHPDDFCFYAIKRCSPGCKKIKNLGHTIRYGGLKHWLYYMSADLNISSQKSGNPCPIFWYFVQVKLGLYRNRVFLQHGITKDDSEWLYFKNTKFKYFVCGSKREYDYILKKFGYKNDNLLLTGFARWDNLKDTCNLQKDKSILVMPTWRNWLVCGSNRLSMNDFKKTDYFKYWNCLINDDDLIKYIEKNNIKIYFYPHINMSKYIKSFRPGSQNIQIISCDSDIQDYFNKCNLMITDYSSVAFDFAYLRKNVIYYQFDDTEYRSMQLQKGYYDYAKDGFGPIAKNNSDVINMIKTFFSCGFDDVYEKHINDFFNYRDFDNSERLYLSLCAKSVNTINSGRLLDANKKVSIIVPTYNCVDYIDRCLDHLINQTYDNIEIIVVDDGSSDGTIAAVKEYAILDNRIKLIKQKHSGPNIARFKGIKKAIGSYVMFVDADDFIMNWSIEKIVAAFNRFDVDVVRFGAKFFPSGTVFGGMDNVCSDDGLILNHEGVIKTLLTTYKLNNLSTQVYKLENLKGINSFKSRIILGEDFLANLEIHDKTSRMLILNIPAYCYCDNPNSTTRKTTRSHVREKIANRVYVSDVAIRYALANINDRALRNEVFYSQIKMVRDSLLDIVNLTKYDYDDFKHDFRKILSKNTFAKVDSIGFSRYLNSLGVVERAKNRRIIHAIIESDFEFIWKYIRIYKNTVWRLKCIF